MKPAMQAMADLCADRLERFGTAGNASRLKLLTLSAMASRYAAGELDPVIG